MPPPSKKKFPEKYDEYCKKKSESLRLSHGSPLMREKLRRSHVRGVTKTIDDRTLENILKRLYLEEKKSSCEIAKELEVGTDVIFLWLKRFKIKLRDKKEEVELSRIKRFGYNSIKLSSLLKEDYLKGFGGDELAEKWGVNRGCIYRWLVEFKIPRRSKSELMYKVWKDEEFQTKQKCSRNVRPTHLENKVIQLLQEMNLVGWKYTGDFSFWIGGKNPDFVNEEQKKIIEVNGHPGYYHFQDETEKKVKFFKKHGYDTLVIWENELYRKLKLVQKKIELFTKKQEVLRC